MVRQRAVEILVARRGERRSRHVMWALLKSTVEGFIADDALSRGASIAYYTLFALAPVLLIVLHKAPSSPS